LCATERTRVKWVFVPSHALGRTLGERIALAGTDWLNLRFVTPLDIALRMGAPFLVERGIDPSEEGLGPALMMRLLLDLPEQGGYFRPLADQPSLADAVWTTLRELRMAGLGSDDLPAAAFESPAKHAEIVALLSAYEAHLEAQGRADMATVYAEALKHPDWCPIQPQDCWTELPHVLWTPLQRRLFDALPGERLTPQILELPNVAVPRRLKAAPVVFASPVAAANPLAFLMAPPDIATPGLAVFHAGGREAEVEEVFRRILAAGAPLDTVEIACASEAHVALAWEKALRHEWPVTLGRGIAAAQTRPGRALLGLCDWIETDVSAGHLRRLLQSGDVEVDAEAFGFTAHQAAGILARAEAGWGRETYRLALGRLRHYYATRAADLDRSDEDRKAATEKADRTALVLAQVTALLDSIPVPGPDGRVPLQAVVGAALHFLEQSAAQNSALDARAASGLADHVGDLRELGAFTCSLPAALRFVRERVQSLSIAPERPRPGHVYVCDLAHAGFAGRSVVFIVGLEEGRVFPAATEDPVLLDRERTAISPHLRLSTDRLDEAVYAVLARLATSGSARVTCSYSCRDTREFRETYASWLMLQICRVQQGNPTLSYPQMKALLGEPVSIVPADRGAAATASTWMVRSVLGTGDAGLAAIDQAFAGVAHGRQALAARASTEFTEFDGGVPAAGPLLDPCAPGIVYSVTELEGAAGCPFRVFLKRGLGIRPLDDGERERDVWLDPLTRGSALHDLYARTLRRCRDAKRRPDMGVDWPWLRALAEERLAALNREMPAPTVEIHDRESQQFLADAELFLAEECRPSTAIPVALEVSFGRPLDDEAEPLARQEPIEIDLGAGLTIRVAGQIDRINQVGPDAFEVLDYKTGSYWRDNWLGTFAGGRRLQHALYGLAAVELLRAQHKNPTVESGVYYFSSHRGGLERVTIPAPGKAAIARVLADLREVIVHGAFVHAPTEEACRFCDYAAACGKGVHGQAEAKQGDARLATFVRLGTHA
jgi:ATP-dependent helicase/nuclease subunit B